MISEQNSLHPRPRPLVLLGFLALFAGLSSCTEDAFSQLVEVPLPEHVPLPVLSLELRAGDSTYQAVVGRSYSILDAQPLEAERATRLRLYRNDVLISDRVGTIGDHLGFNNAPPVDSLADTLTNGVATYHADIEVQDIGSATATQIMPAVPVFDVTGFVEDGAVDVDGYRRDVINIAIDDPAGSEDYYLIRIIRDNTQTYCQTDSLGNEFGCQTYTNIGEYTVDSPDPVLRPTGYYSIAASDRSFNGTRREFRLEVDVYSDENTTVYVIVEGLTEDGYRYLTSKYTADEADGNPFAEPVNVHSNIEGGVGIFMVSSKATKLVER